MLPLRLFGRGVDEHLELVELVHADDAAGVLAVRPGLAAVAGRPAGVALGTAREIDDLVHVVAGERHFAGADQVEVLIVEVIDLGGVLAQESGAAHDLGAHQRRRDDGGEARLQRTVEAQVHERDLEARADAREEVEPAARHLGAALHVDRAEPLAQLEVVAGLEAERGDLAVRAQRDEVVLAARGHTLDDDVLDRGEGLGGCLLRGGDRVLGLLHSLAEQLALGDERRLLLFRGLRHPLAVRVLRGAELFERGDRRAPCAIGLHGDVDGVGRLAPRLLRALDQLGIVAKQHGIDHSASLVGTPVGHSRRPVRHRGGSPPARTGTPFEPDGRFASYSGPHGGIWIGRGRDIRRRPHSSPGRRDLRRRAQHR